jgi:hypothetical protein
MPRRRRICPELTSDEAQDLIRTLDGFLPGFGWALLYCDPQTGGNFHVVSNAPDPRGDMKFLKQIVSQALINIDEVKPDTIDKIVGRRDS